LLKYIDIFDNYNNICNVAQNIINNDNDNDCFNIKIGYEFIDFLHQYKLLNELILSYQLYRIYNTALNPDANNEFETFFNCVLKISKFIYNCAFNTLLKLNEFFMNYVNTKLLNNTHYTNFNNFKKK
jgi:hypothetical protein